MRKTKIKKDNKTYTNNSSNNNNNNSSSGSNNNSNNNYDNNNNNSNSNSNNDSNNVKTCLYKFVIISYTLISLMIDTLEEINFKVIIADECHYLKNANAARSKGVILLLRKSSRAVLLSGTPALSRPMELFTQLNALEPLAWPDMKAFGRRSE